MASPAPGSARDLGSSPGARPEVTGSYTRPTIVATSDGPVRSLRQWLQHSPWVPCPPPLGPPLALTTLSLYINNWSQEKGLSEFIMRSPINYAFGVKRPRHKERRVGAHGERDRITANAPRVSETDLKAQADPRSVSLGISCQPTTSLS